MEEGHGEPKGSWSIASTRYLTDLFVANPRCLKAQRLAFGDQHEITPAFQLLRPAVGKARGIACLLPAGHRTHQAHREIRLHG